MYRPPPEIEKTIACGGFFGLFICLWMVHRDQAACNKYEEILCGQAQVIMIMRQSMSVLECKFSTRANFKSVPHGSQHRFNQT